MRTRDLSFTFALCASLVLHAMLALAISESYVRDFGKHLWLPAFARESIDESVTPQLAMLRREDDPIRRLGDSDAIGYAIDSSPGQEQLLAPQGMQDQPLLSRDPVGPGRVGDPSTESLIPPGEGASAEEPPLPPSAPLIVPPAEDFAQVGIPAPAKLQSPPAGAAETEQNHPEVPWPPAQPPDASVGDGTDQAAPIGAPASPVPVFSPPTPAAAISESPGLKYAADPAPRGESEIDPVSIIGSVEFRRGSTVAQLGRKHRLTRPRLTVGTRVDLMTMGGSVLVLRIQTDSSGNVIAADVMRSSGSEDLDQLFRITAYEWWFEPPKDAFNQRRADTFMFTIRIN